VFLQTDARFNLVDGLALMILFHHLLHVSLLEMGFVALVYIRHSYDQTLFKSCYPNYHSGWCKLLFSFIDQLELFMQGQEKAILDENEDQEVQSPTSGKQLFFATTCEVCR
jgi:hypothetical protein